MAGQRVKRSHAAVEGAQIGPFQAGVNSCKRVGSSSARWPDSLSHWSNNPTPSWPTVQRPFRSIAWSSTALAVAKVACAWNGPIWAPSTAA
jgi:hypothetical protein